MIVLLYYLIACNWCYDTYIIACNVLLYGGQLSLTVHVVAQPNSLTLF